VADADADAAFAHPAGFWHRYAAWSLDWLLLSAPLALLLWPLLARAWAQLQAANHSVEAWMLARLELSADMPSPLAMALQLLADPALAASLHAAVAGLLLTLSEAALIAFALSALYFVSTEAGPWQATPGKRLAHLRVRAVDGGVAGPRRALLRHLGGVPSWAMLNLGHAIAGWRRDHRALHDLIAGTQVLAEGPMPRWVKTWLTAQAVVLAALFFGVFAWFAWVLLQLARY